jgi:hypothetical protein
MMAKKNGVSRGTAQVTSGLRQQDREQKVAFVGMETGGISNSRHFPTPLVFSARPPGDPAYRLVWNVT